MTTMRAVLYLRVSTVEQVSNLSLDTQERACRDYCDRNGIEIVRVFREEGESATTLDRPRLTELLAFVAKDKIQAVVVYDLSRLSRDTLDTLMVQRQLQRTGAVIRAATQPVDETAEGKMLGTVLAAVSQFENELRKRKVLAGMKEALRRVRWPWHAPLGYLNQGGRCIQNPNVAPLLARAFERAATGVYSVPEINQEAAHSGLRIPRTTMHRVLANPFYAGRLIVPQWGVDVVGEHDPLVDWTTFQRVNGRDTARRSYVTGATETFPFRQITRCECGKPLTGYFARSHTGARHPYYRCQPCRMNTKAGALQREFSALLDGLSAPPRHVDLFLAMVRESLHELGSKRGDIAQAAARKAQATKRRLERVTEAFLYEQSIDKDTYQREQRKLSDALRNLEVEAGATAPPPETFEPAIAFGRELLQTPIAAWSRVPDDRRPAFLRAVFPDGLTWERDGKFRTPSNSIFSMHLQGDSMHNSEEWYTQLSECRTGTVLGWITSARIVAEIVGAA